jgi:TonB family protein
MSGRSAVVHYEFTVGEDGKISDVTITSSTDNAFAKELARVIKHSPKWKPAMKDGKPVPYTIKNQTAHFGQVD